MGVPFESERDRGKGEGERRREGIKWLRWKLNIYTYF